MLPIIHRNLSSPAAALLVSAFLSAWLYWAAFVQSAVLLELYEISRLDGSFLQQQGRPTLWHFILSFMALAILYGLAWQAARRSSHRSAWLIVVGGSLVMGAILLFMAPFDSSDIYDNIVHGRILGVYNDNPFKQLGIHYLGRDPFVRLMGWPRSPSAYGPLWEMLAAVTAILAGDGILANLIAFKIAGRDLHTG